MEVHSVIVFLFAVVVQVHSVCYELNKERRLFMKYKTEDLSDLTERSDFQFHFKTISNDNQILYYTETKDIDEKDASDYESLYIYDGFLHYMIFNPTIYGTGSSRGGHAKTNFEVNNGTWITVEFFRNKESEVPAGFSGDGTTLRNETGMIVNGEKFVAFSGTMQPLNIHLSDIYVGGHVHLEELTGKLLPFDGLIDEFKDLKSNTELTSEHPGSTLITSKCDRVLAPFA